MPLSPPPPPSISPRQMTLMRVVAAMAWSDGNLAETEVDLMLDRFSRLFASDAHQQSSLRQELRDYLMQNIPLEELVPQLQNQAERELVLRLGYEVISASSRTPEEAAINQEEANAYHRLVKLLALPPTTVAKVEAEAQSAQSDTSKVDRMVEELHQFFHSK